MQDSWPSVDPGAERGSSLPRVEDLPVVAQGYDPERVREAFDAFYRHLARLDATLRTIEAVEVFREQAGELRKELRALRTAGWTQQPWLPSYSTRESARPGVPDAVLRWALEAGLVIAAPVAASAADLSRLWILLAAGAAVAIVAIAEWVAAREGPLVPARVATPALPPEKEEAPASAPPGDATTGEWTLPPGAEQRRERAEDAEAVEEAEELTAVASGAPTEAEDEAQPAQEEASGPDVQEPQRRRRWSLRRTRGPEGEQPEPDEDRPRHVRVLSGDDEVHVEPPLDPWEEELDLEADSEPDPASEPAPPRGWGS